jgi:hypothetical protein
MLKGEPVDESEILKLGNNLPKPDLLTQKKIIEAENPELAQGLNPFDGVDVQKVPNTNMINGVRFPGTSVLNPNNSIVPSNNPNPNGEEIRDGIEPGPEHRIPEDQKIPYIHGEKTIICWNCVSVLMVKEEWSVVRCTNCGKINRVPGTEDNIDGAIRLNDNMNHFDLYVPFVYAVITCPFCQAENKVRKDAEHVICFQCHNSYNIQHEPWENMVANKIINNKEYPIVQQPTVVNTCDNSGNEETQRLLKKLIKTLKNQENNKKPIPIIPPLYDSYRPIRELVRDVDDIDDKRFNGVRKKNLYGPIGDLADPRLKSPFIDRGISEISKKISNIDIKVENKNNNPLLGQGKDMEMESLKRKLYDEIRNDPKYKASYGYMGRMNKYDFSQKPFSFGYNGERKKTPYFSDKPKNDAVYKNMFRNNVDLKKSYDINSGDIDDAENILLESKTKFKKGSMDATKLPIGKTLKTKEEVYDILKNLNIDFQI